MNKEQELLQRVFEYYTAGSLSYGDFKALFQYCEGKEAVVELGTNTGSTAELLAMMCGKVFTVDVFEDRDRIENKTQREFYKKQFADSKRYDAIRSRLKNYKNVEILKDLTYLAAKSFDDLIVDVLFMDADHSFDGLNKDYVAWFVKVKEGGIFLVHDVIKTDSDNNILKEVFPFVRDIMLKDNRIEEIPIKADGCFSTIRAFKKLIST